MTKKYFQFGSKTIEYTLEYSERKTLGITVTPELNIIVKAPLTAEPEKIEAILHKRANWILKQKSFFLAYYPKQPAKAYVSGETHLYMGRQYRLKIYKSKTESVKLCGKFITVNCTDTSRAKKLLDKWYKRHAETKFDEYCNEWIEQFRRYRVTPSEIQIRVMSKRWGSCTGKGKIILNPELIKAPRGCIEYVIVHELCHLVYASHNKQFITLQTRMLPTWEIWKERLEKLLA